MPVRRGLVFSGRVLTTAVLTVIFSAMAVMALGFAPEARFLPLLVSIPATLLCVVQLVIDVRNARFAADGGTRQDAETRREIGMFAWLLAFLAGNVIFGFLWASPVLALAYLRLQEGASWTVSFVGGAGIWVVVFGVFDRLLETPLYEGFLPAWIGALPAVM
jgi:hypothetical protein